MTLAAHCGHPPALHLIGGDLQLDHAAYLSWLDEDTSSPWRLAARQPECEWIAALAHWGKEPCVRAAVAVARQVPEDDPEGEAAVEHAEQWIVGSAPAREEAARRVAEHVVAAAESGRHEPLCAYYAVLTAAQATVEGVAKALNRCVFLAVTEIDGLTRDHPTPARPGLKEVICAELIPWALGWSDPVRERVEERSRESRDR